MTNFESILFEKTDGIAYITLNRPQSLNAYNTRMRDELYQILGVIRDDSEIRVAILKGAGEKAFCAGADLTEFLTAPPPVFAREVRWERDVWGLFMSVTKPFIAALHGYVLGSGIEMSLFCDIRIASEDAQFALPEVNLGIIPAAGGSQTLPRTVSRSAALEMLLTGKRINAREALRLKLVNRVVPRRELLPEVEKLANKIKGFNPQAVACAKQAVTKGLNMTLEKGLELESNLAASLNV